MRFFILFLSIFVFAAAPAPAQTKGAAKTQLRKMVRAAKKNPDKLFEAASYARKNELDKDFNKLLKPVVGLL